MEIFAFAFSEHTSQGKHNLFVFYKCFICCCNGATSEQTLKHIYMGNMPEENIVSEDKEEKLHITSRIGNTICRYIEVRKFQMRLTNGSQMLNQRTQRIS